MSYKFKANIIDLSLELTTLDGTELMVDVPKDTRINADYAIKVMKHFNESRKVATNLQKDLEESDDDAEQEEIADKIAGLKNIAADQLHYVYEHESSDWWMKNFDMKVISDILQHVCNELVGLKKRKKN